MIELEQAKKKSKSCCEVEAIVSFDERGQLVFPKDVRKKFDLKAGEKFAMVSCVGDNGLCCFTLVKTSAINDMVTKSLSPMMGGLMK
jgi:AbrB family looped-hinge helix DNA binding protein